MRRAAGFTLIEILLVVGVLGILAGITLGISSGIREHRREQQARGELAALAVALESYRAEHGDYPVATGTGERGGNAGTLLASLAPPEGSGPTFLHRERFTRGPAGETLLDPWKNPYVYRYDPDWTARAGFLLYSRGPDGDHEPPSPAGRPDRSAPANLDNLSP